MTAVVAWERKVGSVSELIVASDSRLSGGERWDACAKIFDVGRSDAFIAFAGDTTRALPLIFQAIATTRSYEGSFLRTLDLPKFAGHLNAVMNEVLMQAHGTAAEEPPDCEFLLGGWSWSIGSFRLYRYYFDKNVKAFRCYPITKVPKSIGRKNATKTYGVIGDAGPKVTGLIARERGTNGRMREPLQYEPLEILHRLTKDPAFDTVGGNVQVVKVYRSIRVETFAVKSGDSIFVSGRPALPYENLTLRVITRDADGGWSVDSALKNREDELSLPARRIG